jgi:hypothetical protein
MHSVTGTSPAVDRAARRPRRKGLLAAAAAVLLGATALGGGEARAALGGDGEAADWPEPRPVEAAAHRAPADGLLLLGPSRVLPGPRAAMLEAAAPLRLLAPGALAASPAAYVNTPIVSGLPWRSGATSTDGSFGVWRGRPMDVIVTFVEHTSWASMYKKLRSKTFRGLARLTPQMVVSLASFPRSYRRAHAECAAGAFDQYFREFGAIMLQQGAGSAIVRLGWETNAGSSHQWGIDTAAEIPNYVACFRRQAEALKSGAPGLQIEWTNAKKGKLNVSELATYPGDDVVDLWGVHYYDSGPQKTTQALWDQYVNATHLGGPWGIGAWLAEAKARGKKLGVPEWGVWNQGISEAAADNPVYIENMYRFFRDNAADIAYENYYNTPLKHQLHPSTRYPRASARYRELWSAGQ